MKGQNDISSQSTGGLVQLWNCEFLHAYWGEKQPDMVFLITIRAEKDSTQMFPQFTK